MRINIHNCDCIFHLSRRNILTVFYFYLNFNTAEVFCKLNLKFRMMVVPKSQKPN